MEVALTDKTVPRLSILLARAFLYLAIGATFAGLTWACIAQVSVVVSARGRLAPRAEPVRLSVPEGGVVSAVLVEVGAKATAGQPILEIDSFRETAEVARVRRELDEIRAEADGYRDSARILASATDDLKQELASSETVLSLTAKQTQALHEAYQGGAVSLYFVQTKEAEMAQTQAQIAQYKADLNRAEAEDRKDRSTALGMDEKIKGLTIELDRDIQAKQRMVLTAPISGTVSHINSLRPGLYLAANEVAATIVPTDEPLLAEVWIPNNSIRRVKPSLRTRMKLDAYPFQQFGLLSGTLISVDPDADDSGSYRAWIKPDGLFLEDAHGIETMRTGLALTAEIEVERRTVMSVLLDPFQRLRSGFRFSQ
jgi:hemolysin D